MMRARQPFILALGLLLVIASACDTTSRRTSGTSSIQLGPEGRPPVVLPKCTPANVTPTAVASFTVTNTVHKVISSTTFSQCEGVTLTPRAVLLNPDNGGESLEAEFKLGSLTPPSLDTVTTAISFSRSKKVEFRSGNCQTRFSDFEPYSVTHGDGIFQLGVKASGTTHCGSQGASPPNMEADIVFVIDSCLPKFGLPEKELDCPAPTPRQ